MRGSCVGLRHFKKAQNFSAPYKCPADVDAAEHKKRPRGAAVVRKAALALDSNAAGRIEKNSNSPQTRLKL